MIVAGITTASLHSSTSQDDQRPPKSIAEKEREFAETIQPLIDRHCLDCHNDDSAEGDFSMESFDSAISLLDYRNTWLKVLRRLETSEMPPDDANEMSDAERSEMVGWLDDHLNNIDCDNLDHPGSVTIRRLTKIEYRNTVRDLVGVDYEPAADFPADDIGYGFDNIGDVLSLPPLLMEKYLHAAEEISREAIRADAYATAKTETILASSLDHGDNARTSGSGELVMFSSGTAGIEIDVPLRGRYEIKIRAYGDQAGDEPAKMALSVDGRQVREFSVRAEEGDPDVYTIQRQLGAGERKLEFTFVNDYYRPNDRGERNDRNLILQRIELVGPLDHRPSDLPKSHTDLIYERPDRNTTVDEASYELIIRLASRAYRRPATDEEIARLQSLVHLAMDNGDSFEAGMQLVVQAVLVSPYFLFKVEEPIPANEIERRLTRYELATSLSYLLWSTMPDDDLLLAAWNDELKTPGQLEDQVDRMLADRKVDAFIENFCTQWLQLRALDQFSPDPDLFPTFDQELRRAMQEETVLFFGDIVRNDRSVLDLFEADFTYLNQRLAEHYGYRQIFGDEFRKVSLAGTSRGGLLMHASFLTVTSNPSRTSPVKRGKWIIENLLGEPPPPPAPNVVPLENQTELTGTLRERMQQHRDNPSCASCHARMDPLGFALENFDALGRWREYDEGSEIDAAGVLPSGERFDGPLELRSVLLESKREELVRCLVEKLLTYALGRGLEYYDRCAVDDIVEQASHEDYRVSAILLAIVQSEPFQRRRLRRGEP